MTSCQTTTTICIGCMAKVSISSTFTMNVLNLNLPTVIIMRAVDQPQKLATGLHFCIAAASTFFSSISCAVPACCFPLSFSMLLLSVPCISNSKQICRLGAPGATFYERVRDAAPQIRIDQPTSATTAAANCSSLCSTRQSWRRWCHVCLWHTHKDVLV